MLNARHPVSNMHYLIPRTYLCKPLLIALAKFAICRDPNHAKRAGSPERQSLKQRSLGCPFFNGLSKRSKLFHYEPSHSLLRIELIWFLPPNIRLRYALSCDISANWRGDMVFLETFMWGYPGPWPPKYHSIKLYHIHTFIGVKMVFCYLFPAKSEEPGCRARKALRGRAVACHVLPGWVAMGKELREREDAFNIYLSSRVGLSDVNSSYPQNRPYILCACSMVVISRILTIFSPLYIL